MFNFIENYSKYGKYPSYWDMCKAFAIIIMIVDHIGAYFYTDDLWWRAVGRLCVPIWLFLVGYAKKPNSNQIELYIFAIILIVIDFIFGHGIFPINILLTIIMCRFFIQHIESYDRDIITFLLIFIMLLVLHIIAEVLFEYGSIGLLFALCGYYSRQKRGLFVVFTLNFSNILFCISQQVIFDFNILQFSFIIIGTTFICYMLQRLQFSTSSSISTHSLILDKICMFIARNSLYIYIIHITIFIIIGWLLSDNPISLFTVKWINWG